MHARRRTTSEQGQGSLETVGVVTLASLLVAATTGAVVQSSPSVRAEVGYRVCQVTTLGGGGCEDPGDQPTSPWQNESVTPPADGGPPVDPARLPDEPCVTSSASGSVSMSASFVATAGGEQGVLVEQLSDGTFRLTTSGGGSLGAGVGFGAEASVEIDGVPQGSGGFADANAALAASGTQTYYAADEQELQDVMVRLMGERMLDSVAPRLPGPADVPFIQDIPVIGDLEGPPNPLRDAVDVLVGDPPEPDEQYVEVGIEGDAGAMLAGIAYSTGAGVDMGVFGGLRTTPDGYVLTSVGEGSGEAWASALGGEAMASAGASYVRELHLASDGTPLGITVTVTGAAAASSGDVGPATDAQGSTVVTAWVPFTGDVATDARIWASAANPLLNAQFVEDAMDTGTFTIDTYESDPNTYGLSANVDIGPAAGGGSITGDMTTSTMVSSSYWTGSGFADRPC